MRHGKKRSLENTARRLGGEGKGSSKGGCRPGLVAGWLLGWCGDGNGDPCSDPPGLSRMLHEGTWRLLLGLILGGGLESECPRRGPNPLGGLLPSPVIFLP